RLIRCDVCQENLRARHFPALDECTHKPTTCSRCLSQWIKSQLETKGCNSIKCPGNGCRHILSYYEVKYHASRQVFERYDELVTRSSLASTPDFRWCGTPGCTSGQIHQGAGNIFQCNACGSRQCVIHNVNWHEGLTCEQYDRQRNEQRILEENASVRAISCLTKRCPGPGCNRNIEKNGGCDHMTCSVCYYEFCWECLASFDAIRTQGNSAHMESCEH
ncbi:hypothetical protein BU24DRAFT_316371, partial [Aaosphaeria arxii CBS 175.79]